MLFDGNGDDMNKPMGGDDQQTPPADQGGMNQPTGNDDSASDDQNKDMPSEHPGTDEGTA